MKRLLVLVSAATAILAGGGAQAKLPSDVELCGASGCTRVGASEAHEMLFQTWGRLVPPAAPAPYYVLRWAGHDGRQITAYWIPSAGVLRQPGTRTYVSWTLVEPENRAGVDAVTAGIDPFAPPTLTRVVVGTRAATHPESYVPLLVAGRLTSRSRGARGWIRIRVESSQPSPWTDGTLVLRVSRAKGFLLRNGWLYHIPVALADRARRGVSLDG